MVINFITLQNLLLSAIKVLFQTQSPFPKDRKKEKKRKKKTISLQTCPFGLVQILHEHDNKANRKKLELSFLPWKLVEPLARPRPSDGKSFAKPFFVGPLLIFLVSLSLSLSLYDIYIYIFLIIKLINFLFMLVSNYKLQILIFLVIIGFACRRRPI